MMVTRWGLSEELGTVAYGENQEEVFLGYSVARQQNISEETAQKIDAEIRRLVEAGYAEATKILTEKRADLETLARGPARVRDAVRRRDQGPARRQAPGARVRDRADDAALLRGAVRRQGPPAASRRAARPAARAAGVSAITRCETPAARRAFLHFSAHRPTHPPQDQRHRRSRSRQRRPRTPAPGSRAARRPSARSARARRRRRTASPAESARWRSPTTYGSERRFRSARRDS